MSTPPHFYTGSPASLMGAQALDRDGALLGIVAQVWTRDATGEANWIAVTDGPHATTTSVVPVAGATQPTAGLVQLAFPASAMLTAPRIADITAVTAEQEQTLLQHYWPAAAAESAGTDPARGTLVRAEERLHVDVVSVPYARARLRIETTSEQVMVPVTLTRQHARLEFLELPAAGSPAQVDQSWQASWPTHTPWVTLLAEEPLITTRQVPVERVRLDITRVTAEQTVTEVLGHEEIAVEHLTATQERPAVPAPTRTT